MKPPRIIDLAKQALPLMAPADRAEAEQLLAECVTANSGLTAAEDVDFKTRGKAAWQRDMQAVCKAIVEALQAGDMEALRGLQAMLPHLLKQANANPEFADVLAHQVGAALLTGLELGEMPPDDGELQPEEEDGE